jgi:hypothetical protein
MTTRRRFLPAPAAAPAALESAGAAGRTGLLEVDGPVAFAGGAFGEAAPVAVLGGAALAAGFGVD